MECTRGLAMRIVSVCLSVRPSVKRVNGDKDLSIFYTIRKSIYPNFSEMKNGWWGAIPSTWNFGSTALLEWDRRFWTDIRS